MPPFSTPSSSAAGAFTVLNPPQFPTTPKAIYFPFRPKQQDPLRIPLKDPTFPFRALRGSGAVSIEKEVLESERPNTFLHDSGGGGNGAVSTGSVRVRFEKMIREVQDRVCEAIEEVEGGGSFKEDVWSRRAAGAGSVGFCRTGVSSRRPGLTSPLFMGLCLPRHIELPRLPPLIRSLDPCLSSPRGLALWVYFCSRSVLGSLDFRDVCVSYTLFS